MSTPSFLDFIQDKDGEYSEAQFISLAKKLEQQGKNMNQIVWAMVNATVSVSEDRKLWGHYTFLKTAGSYLNQCAEQLAEIAEEVSSRRQEDNPS